MNWKTMKQIEPQLQRLAESARFAGSNGSPWIETWMALVEPLSKCVGHSGHHEELRADVCYSEARWALHQAWRDGEAEQTGEQAELFDVSEMYE